MTDRRNFFDQLLKNDLRTYDHIRKIATGKEMITQLFVYLIISLSKIIIR